MVDVSEDPLGVMGNIGGDIGSSTACFFIVVDVLEDPLGVMGNIGAGTGLLDTAVISDVLEDPLGRFGKKIVEDIAVSASSAL